MKTLTKLERTYLKVCITAVAVALLAAIPMVCEPPMTAEEVRAANVAEDAAQMEAWILHQKREAKRYSTAIPRNTKPAGRIRIASDGMHLETRGIDY